jgi:chorismate synthase
MSSTGRVFRVTTFGESHGGGVGCIVEGVPPRMQLSEADVQVQLDRRRPGQSAITTDRQEGDKVQFLSGVELGRTLGSPLCMLVRNADHRPGDYSETSRVPRPSHADYTYLSKYGINASSGGGRASARETIGRVAAGAVAERWLAAHCGVEIVAYVSAVGTVSMGDFGETVDEETVSRELVDRNVVRCPCPKAAAAMEEHILALKARQVFC